MKVIETTPRFELPKPLVIQQAPCVKHNGEPSQLHLGDGVQFLSGLANRSVDLILTDPPYEVSRPSGFKNIGTKGIARFAVSMDFGKWDWGFTKLKPALEQSYRVLRPGGAVVVWYDLWKITELAKLLQDCGFKQLRFVEWVKTNPVPLNSKRNYLTNAREIAITAVKGGGCTFNSQYDNGIYRHPIYHNTHRFHPTQKPVALFAQLIKKHTQAGDLVVDPFMGSATTAIAAMQTNRRWLGSELDPQYHEKALARIEREENL